MNNPIIIAAANFGVPVFAVRFPRGRTIHAVTSLKHHGWSIRLTQTGRDSDFCTISAGSSGITLCDKRFGYMTGVQAIIGQDDARKRCTACVRRATAETAVCRELREAGDG